MTRTIRIESGGHILISADLDIFSLNARDRSFILGLIEQVEKYEAGRRRLPSGLSTTDIAELPGLLDASYMSRIQLGSIGSGSALAPAGREDGAP